MGQISAKIVADSISPQGKRITSFELSYPRFIHSELMTHRVFSRNAMSSRAVPIEKMIEQVMNSPAKPIHWGKNQPGMQAKEELSDTVHVDFYWEELAKEVGGYAAYFSKQGLHKQVVNRVLEPFQTMKTVLTATEFENFFWLRNHEDAQPEIKKLAEGMLKAMEQSKPIPLLPGEWHLPYYGEHGGLFGSFSDQELKEAKAISASCCAQVSYRKLDDSLEKALKVYERLVESEPVHASPFEHQATPFEIPNCDYYTDAIWEALGQQGATHIDTEQNIWSGNFCGWAQHRQLIPNNVKKG
jgi:thymidylate synthase ThyX